MGRSPTLVLICGTLSTRVGVAMLAVSGRVEGLVWLATAIVVIGLCLSGAGLSNRYSSESRDGSLPASERLPGRCYPYAVVGVGIALWAWVVYWTKFR